MVNALLKFSKSIPLAIILVKIVREMLFAELDLLLYLVFLKLFLVHLKFTSNEWFVAKCATNRQVLPIKLGLYLFDSVGKSIKSAR